MKLKKFIRVNKEGTIGGLIVGAVSSIVVYVWVPVSDKASALFLLPVNPLMRFLDTFLPYNPILWYIAIPITYGIIGSVIGTIIDMMWEPEK